MGPAERCRMLLFAIAALALAVPGYTTQAADQGVSPGSKPYIGFPIPTSKVRITGAVVRVIRGDFLTHPRFSPDGRFLAFAESLLEKDGNPLLDDHSHGSRYVAEVRVLEIASGRIRTVLMAEYTAQFGYYCACLRQLSWTGTDLLEAVISDGDVTHTRVTIDINDQEPFNTGDLSQAGPGPAQQSVERWALERLGATHPAIETLELRWHDKTRAIALSSQRNGDPGRFALLVDGSGGHIIADVPDISDLDIDPRGRFVALNHPLDQGFGITIRRRRF